MGNLTPAQVDEDCVAESLESAFLPDPDLIIRSSGEFRLSNFFLWQAAYSEIYITQKMWPDFTMADLEEALVSFANRERRFGRIEVAHEPLESFN
jgi:undecaprenyl diphosphate synthase